MINQSAQLQRKFRNCKTVLKDYSQRLNNRSTKLAINQEVLQELVELVKIILPRLFK